MGNIETYAPHLGQKDMNSLLRWGRKADFNKGYRGGTALWLPRDGETGGLYSKVFTDNGILPENFKKTMKTVWNIFYEGGKVAPILGYARNTEGEGIPNSHHRGKYRDFIFMYRAPGKRLNDINGTNPILKTQERLENGSIQHYDAISKTFVQLTESNVVPDYSDKNTLYHPVAGFNFVDFNKSEFKKHYGHYEYNTENFLKSFLFLGRKTPHGKLKNFFQDEEQKREYFNNYARKEQGILIDRLCKHGVEEGSIKFAIDRIKELDDVYMLYD